MPVHGRALVAALDIGGTKTAAALVSATGDVVARREAATPGREGADAIVATGVSLVAALVEESGTTVQSLGVGSAGVVDPERGLVTGATETLAGWAGTPLADRLADATGLRTRVVNDVHAHALGEASAGAARGARTSLFVGVGTGIGGAFVVDGRVLTGAHHAAGHIGHQPSPYAVQLTCTCGGTGHLEAFASGPGLHAEHARLAATSVADLRAVVALADDGDATAIDVLARGGAAVGSAIGGLVNVLDPHVVAVGGGVSGAGEVWWQALRSAAASEVLPALRDTAIERSTLGSDAALVGAATLVRDALADGAVA